MDGLWWRQHWLIRHGVRVDRVVVVCGIHACVGISGSVAAGHRRLVVLTVKLLQRAEKWRQATGVFFLFFLFLGGFLFRFFFFLGDRLTNSGGSSSSSRRNLVVGTRSPLGFDFNGQLQVAGESHTTRVQALLADLVRAPVEARARVADRTHVVAEVARGRFDLAQLLHAQRADEQEGTSASAERRVFFVVVVFDGEAWPWMLRPICLVLHVHDEAGQH